MSSTHTLPHVTPRPFKHAGVAAKFAAYPAPIQEKLLWLREFIFSTAEAIPEVGEIEETLKWQEPAYVTARSKSGSTIRIDWKPSAPHQYAMYFHCQTTLVETFRTLFPHDFKFEGHRCLVWDEADVVPHDALRYCIAAALTYHLKR